jgi:hypothetical protein
VGAKGAALAAVIAFSADSLIADCPARIGIHAYTPPWQGAVLPLRLCPTPRLADYNESAGDTVLFKADINYQQKLLSMYRSILAEYLRQCNLWEKRKVPIFLSSKILVIRSYIVDVKGCLRGWKIAVSDHPDDEGSDDDRASEVAHYRDLLKVYRQRLPIHLKQQEQFGENLAPPMIIHELQNARSEIQRIKAILRAWNIVVEDLPEEEPV